MTAPKKNAQPVATGQGVKNSFITSESGITTRGTAPAFQLYASDMISNRAFRLMSLAERGLLLTLLCECWINGNVPAREEELGALIGKAVDGTFTDRVAGFFERRNGVLISPELEAYRMRVMDRRMRMVEGGSRGGKRRAEKASSHPSKEPSSHHSSLPNVFDQTTLKGRKPEPEPEPESPSQVGAIPVLVIGGAA